MSWLVGVDHVRLEFVLVAQEEGVSLAAACRQFQISRRTGYKWLGRYRREGLAGLADRSRRPHTALSLPATTALAIVRLRQAHPYWGPKKVRALLRREGVAVAALPSVATIGRVLRCAGMSQAKGRGRPRRGYPAPASTAAGEPNAVWTVDFKGWWRTGEGARCEPLGIRDLYSRYLLCLEPVRRRDTATVQAVFAETFARYGLPAVIRSDNGAPFASLAGPHGLTKLSAWWRTLGIALERIAPGHPEQNGGHERMHGDLAREIEGAPSATWEQEARRLEQWRREFNLCRPHEALGMRTPAEVYRRSPRRLPEAAVWRYPPAFQRRRVNKKGTIKLDRRLRFVSEALAGHEVGLEFRDLETIRVWFCDLLLGELDRGLGAPLRPPAEAPRSNPNKV
jgi:transposase InsO family protein